MALSLSTPGHVYGDAASLIATLETNFMSLNGTPLCDEGIAYLLFCCMAELEATTKEGRLNQQQLTKVQNLLTCYVHSRLIIGAPLAEGVRGEIQCHSDSFSPTARLHV